MAFATNMLPSHRSYDSVLAGMLLAGWSCIDQETGNKLISNEEMRLLLLNVDDDFRSKILWQVKSWIDKKGESGHEKWLNLLPEFLRIWPRQISVRSSKVSTCLCELAFSDVEQFPLVAELIFPLLTKIERDRLMLPGLRRLGDRIVSQYPIQILDILYAVLPDNARAWPYGIEVILKKIGEVDKKLNTDERLIALKRRWNSQ